MPRDGSGDFSRAVAAYVNGNVADADDMNTEMADMATALSDSLNKAGTKALAANLPAGGFILTGLGAGSAAGHSVRYEQVFPSVFQPLDATLTALAALSWASLTPVLQWTAADTVSLTSTPKVTTLDLGDATDTTLSRSAAGVLAVEGVDVVQCAGTQTVAGAKTFTSNVVISNAAATLTLEETAGQSFSFVSDANSLQIGRVGVANIIAISGVSGGGTGLMDIAIPHRARRATSSETTGTLTSASANKKVLASGGITLDDGVFTAGDDIVIEGNGTARTITRAAGATMYIGDVDSATGTLSANGVMGVIVRSSTVFVLTGDIV